MMAEIVVRCILCGVGLLQETTPPAETTSAVEAKVDPRVDQILTELESVGSQVRDLRCKLNYKVIDTLNFEEYIKHGQILYLEAEPNPKFHIIFDKREQGEVVSHDREWWLFDGQWLWEVNESAKQSFKRQIVAPGEKIDLFNIETAPFPVPFGQKKAQILAHFDVTLVNPVASDPVNTDHLRCIPKPGSRLGDDYDVIDFYILKDLHLPSRISGTEKQGLKVVISDFPDLSKKSMNSKLDRKEFEPLAEWRKFGNPIVETLSKDQPAGTPSKP